MSAEKEIVNDGLVTVSTPQEYYVPGMFLTRPVSEKEKFSDFTDEEVLMFASTERRLRSGLKSLFNVAMAGMYIEEHDGQSVTGHTIPLHIERLSRRFDVSVYQPHIEEYLLSYDTTDIPEQKRTAATMRQYLIGEPHDAYVPQNSGNEFRYEAKEKLPLYQVLDVDDESQIPPAPNGMKYYVCLGGTKNFQAFLAKNTLSKGEFLDMFADELDEALAPVYENDMLVVRQDAKYAIPGFYIVSPKVHYRSIDEMPQATFNQVLLVTRRITQHLTELGITNSHIYHDEKYQSPASAHFWVLPLHNQPHEQPLDRTIYSKDIWTYLDTYARFSDTGTSIVENNRHMRELLKD